MALYSFMCSYMLKSLLDDKREERLIERESGGENLVFFSFLLSKGFSSKLFENYRR